MPFFTFKGQFKVNREINAGRMNLQPRVLSTKGFSRLGQVIPGYVERCVKTWSQAIQQDSYLL